MFFAVGPDGSHEGVGCQECHRIWYSDIIAQKARKVIGHALRAFIDTQEFPADAVAQGDYGRDPRYDQQEFYDYAESSSFWLPDGPPPQPTEPADGIAPNELQVDRSSDQKDEGA